MQGKLYLIPSFLGTDVASEVFPAINTEIVATLTHFIVEDIRTARRFIKRLVPDANIDALHFSILNEHTREQDIANYLTPCQSVSVGLLSDAGVPCVADPGAAIVKIAHLKEIEVVPLVGPSSIILALMASGLNGQSFAFNGYLPVQKADRIKAIKALEKRSGIENQTQLFIETPYRNRALFDDILATCAPTTMLCVACDLTLPSQFISTLMVSRWKTHKPDIHKRPAIFLLKSS